MRFLVSTEEALLSRPLSSSSSLKTCVGVDALRLTTLLTLSLGSFGADSLSLVVDCCEGRFGSGEGRDGAAAGFTILLTGTETVTVLMTGLFFGPAVPKKFMLGGRESGGGGGGDGRDAASAGRKNVAVDRAIGGGRVRDTRLTQVTETKNWMANEYETTRLGSGRVHAPP